MRDMPEAIILCGGAGLRLRSITGNAPKGMAEIGGRPFLELLLRQLHRYGLHRAILAVGYRKDAIRAHFGERAFGLELAYAVESFPLGTGGALRNAADMVESEAVLMMNGDSYTEVDLSRVAAHFHESNADASVVVVPADGRDDCGSVRVDENSNLVRFEEKHGTPHEAYVNAGIYVASRRLLCEIPAGVEISLERELLPRWLREGKLIKGFVCLGRCIDIGTPERYESAQDILASAEAVGSVPQPGVEL
jgi:mannose-1-phosphate guanylyltransferase